MSTDRSSAPPFLPSPAWPALLRAELSRLGLPPDALADALAALGIERGAQYLLRWGDRTLALGARTLLMGVINVTDGSLSGDGLGYDVGAVLARAEALVAAGADILDVGGESTRPGAGAVSAAEERARVEPAVAAIARRLAVPISVDTRKAVVAEAALAAGAGAVNDVSGLRHDRAVAAVAARAGAALILGHWLPRPANAPPPPSPLRAASPNPGGSQLMPYAHPDPLAGGEGERMRPHPDPRPGGEGERRDPQSGTVHAEIGAALPEGERAGPLSPWERAGGEGNAVAAITLGLRESIGWALAAGCAPEQVAVDPGLGFGKAPAASLALLRELDALRALGRPILVGPSRKGFIGRVLGPAEQHGWEGTAAVVALAVAGGAAIVRVHDVARLARVVRMADAVVCALSDE